MLKIRLQRVGRKNDPSFRLVVTEHTNAAKKSGRFAEILGSYDARHGEPVVKGDRVKHWLSVGAKPSVTAHNLLVKLGLMEGKTKNPLPKKTIIKKEEPVSEVPAAEAAEAVETPAEVGDLPAETSSDKVEEKAEEQPTPVENS